ncbi:Nif3-like dinuclear metal center hexameric protein [Chitinophagaceae bacterium IBVUCB1]|nr:Nif3-like dinuclear metal center hexameric protein [Chitinophagaceae bacterium IBVUCB1]
MFVKDIIAAIEAFAPVQYQEGYDNSGLQVGDTQAAVTGVLLTLDVTDAVLDEAMQCGANMIVAHHPLIFSGLKRLTGRNYVERIVQKAIKNDIHIYAAHTNLDNVRAGVNAKIAEKLGLVNTEILSVMGGTLRKLHTYVPVAALDKVRDALFAAGAGEIGKYSECSFGTEGKGTFRAAADANPAIGVAGGAREQADEVKLEVLIEKHTESRVLKALFDSHPYEEVAYELVALENKNQQIGAGMVGYLPNPMDEMAFLAYLKERMAVSCIRYTALKGSDIRKAAICGGSGSFLLKDALAAGADVFITGDFKYHQFFDAEGRILIADIGHYESEQYTVEIFEAILNKKFPNFAVLVSKTNTNPVKYYC